MIQLRLRILPIWNAKHRQNPVPVRRQESLCTGTQLASLKQVSAVLQRSHPRAKRKPDPRIMHSCPEAHRWGQLKARNYLCFCDKYEQTMNMPKITFKKAFFRIFWKILAKTGPQSLYLCGFPEARVEMEVAPFRALTHNELL